MGAILIPGSSNILVGDDCHLSRWGSDADEIDMGSSAIGSHHPSHVFHAKDSNEPGVVSSPPVPKRQTKVSACSMHDPVCERGNPTLF
jgi:hypothetical protein